VGFILRVVFQLAVKSDTSSINPVRDITHPPPAPPGDCAGGGSWHCKAAAHLPVSAGV